MQKGGTVAFPTETVYGLGANALDPKAVFKIFEIKKRPTFDPLIVHAASMREAFLLCSEVPEIARTLAKKFWPGALTLVLPKKQIIPDLVTSGLSTVAVRVPNHPVALELIHRARRPLAAPSANPFGRTSPTSAEHVWNDLGEAVDMILDGGSTSIGVESTVLQIQGDQGILLRPGGVTLEELRKIIPVSTVTPKELESSEGILSPGLLKSHYAPNTPLYLVKDSFKETLKWLEGKNNEFKRLGKPWPRIGALCFGQAPKSPLISALVNLSPKKDIRKAASELFQAMRKLDKMEVDLIVAFPVPEMGMGAAVMDRLRKASAGKNNLKPFFE